MLYLNCIYIKIQCESFAWTSSFASPNLLAITKDARFWRISQIRMNRFFQFCADYSWSLLKVLLTVLALSSLPIKGVVSVNLKSLSLCRNHISVTQLSQISSPMSISTRKIGNDNVPLIGFGLMGLSAYYGEPGSDEERFKVHLFSTFGRHLTEKLFLKIWAW